MTKRSHLWLGALVAVSIVQQRLTTDLGLFEAVAFVFGSILPDIDVGWSMRETERTPFKQRTLLASHRGFTHHIIIPIMLIILSFFMRSSNGFMSLYVLYLGLGIALHDALDMLSPLGVPYGFTYQKRIALKFYRTGEVSEYLFVFAVTSIIVVFLFEHFKYFFAGGNT